MNDSTRRRVSLVTSNGWGLGHLSRELAIALAIGDRADVTLFTFSRGFPLVAGFGIRGEWSPGQDSPWIAPDRWDDYVERRFEIFAEEVQPDVVLFDGVAPYVGVINSLRKRPSISFGWLRRGMWLKGPNDGQLHKSTAFDFVIEPGDVSAEADAGPTTGLDSIRVPPVSLLEVVSPIDRAEAADVLGLDAKRPALLVALGAGRLDAISDLENAVLEQAERHQGWQVAVVRSPLGGKSVGATPRDVVEIRDIYPLSSYLSAFDAAVSAAGYNSVHELIPSRVPTLFIPKSASKTDDQTARASFLADHGLALMASDNRQDQVRTQVDRLLGDARGALVERLERASVDDMLGGAVEIAQILTGDPPSGVRDTGPDGWREPGLKGLAKRVVGPTGSNLARRAMGRAPERGSERTAGDETVTRVICSDDPADVGKSDEQPVENMLEGASGSYGTARRELIDEFYDIVG